MKILSALLIFGMLLNVFSGTLAAEENEEAETGSNYNAIFYGVIKNMPVKEKEGAWTINNREVLVNAETVISEEFGQAEVGAYVEVEGDFRDKSFIAYRINIKKDRDEH